MALLASDAGGIALITVSVAIISLAGVILKNVWNLRGNMDDRFSSLKSENKEGLLKIENKIDLGLAKVDGRLDSVMAIATEAKIKAEEATENFGATKLAFVVLESEFRTHQKAEEARQRGRHEEP